MLVQAGALVKGRQSGQGQDAVEEEKLLIAVESSVKEKGGAERIMEGRSILTASFPEFIHELSFSSARGTGCRLR